MGDTKAKTQWAENKPELNPEPKKIESYERYSHSTYSRVAEERTPVLQPTVAEVAKHWYDEYPVEDRRKQLQESIQRRKERQSHEDPFGNNDFINKRNFEKYTPSEGQNYEHYRDRSSDHAETRFEFNKSPTFEENNLEDRYDKKYNSRSYNRAGYVNKRSFVNPQVNSNAEDEKITPISIYEQRQGGRSASHGIGRNYKQYAEPTFNPKLITGGSGDYNNKCDIKFNTKSANYDMSEIELPAYCKNHPDGKLLYIITPKGMESELGCVYCALEVNQEKDKYAIVEVKQKLEEYIDHTTELLRSKPQRSQTDDISTKISICKDREIAMIRQYYDKMMEALAYERDKHIAQIAQIADHNIASVSGYQQNSRSTKPTKNDIKLKNFGIELGKVLDGVEDTGIHIKELWKINQDYNDVVKQKFSENSQNLYGSGVHDLKSFEFQLADDSRLKDLAQRVGQVVTRPVDINYFMNDENDHNDRKSTNQYSNSYSNYRYENKVEYMPTFGGGYGNDEYRKYSNEPTSESKYEYKNRYDSTKYEPSSYDVSKYKYSNPSTYSQYSKYSNGNTENMTKSTAAYAPSTPTPKHQQVSDIVINIEQEPESRNSQTPHLSSKF